MRPWMAVYSRPNFERVAAEKLGHLGRVFYPFLRETKRVNRMHRTRIETVETPYFSRYLFLQSQPHYVRDVRRVEGVCAVVHHRGEPLMVPDSVVSSIMSLADADGCMGEEDFTRGKKFSGKVGDLVKIHWPDHILHGLVTRLTSLAKLDSRGEVSMFLRLLGSEREVSVPVGVVRVLAEAAVG